MLHRRQLLTTLSACGIFSPVFHRALVAQTADEASIDIENIKQAEWISGIELTDDQRTSILENVKQNNLNNRQLREFPLTPDIGPAMHFQTLSDKPRLDSVQRNATTIESLVIQLPASDAEIAFLPVYQLSWLVRTGKITSQRLTEIYLSRLRKYAPMLRCVVTLTEELAMNQAQRADDEINKGMYRGPLHGIPWGAKDLIEVPGYPTTWGIPLNKERVGDSTATVARRLEEAGAVLVAKLSLGALAMGDQWFGGTTRNPWNPTRGSSGSSAGSAAATVAGLVGFSLGSETLGSILSPCTRCGATGFRPTFGRVSRAGCMPLSWSMDKIGPICRSVEDCALVFDAIHGSDGIDATAHNYAFRWPNPLSLNGLKVGFRKTSKSLEERTELATMKAMGCELVEVDLPTDVPLRALTSIIDVEGASVFDQWLRSQETEGWNQWPEIFRAANQISAVDYVRFQRARTRLMHEFEAAIAGVDVLVNMRDLVHTNLTGHPSIVMPVGYKQLDNGGAAPLTVVMTGHLNDDDRLLAIAHAFQRKQDAQLAHPDLDEWLVRSDAGQLDADPPEEN
jgi:Asp-tRNA(Asn)/Glu-tRNA(Gln) amidotransferase A subunit family amidase